MREVLAILLLAYAASAEDLPIAGISHVAFRVGDLEKARAYYTGVLGLPEAFTLGNTHFMKIDDDQYIEVQLGPPLDGGIRMTHISLVTTDVEKLHRMLRDRGLQPGDLKPPGTDGNRAFRLMDPDGNPIEFTQYLPGSLHSNARGKFADAPRAVSHLQHAGWPVKDLHASIAWYRDKLGFVQVYRGDTAKGELPLANMRMPGSAGDYIELGTDRHGCFVVPKIQPVYRTVLSRGGPATPPQMGRTLRMLFNSRDPDGNRIEFIELHETRGLR